MSQPTNLLPSSTALTADCLVTGPNSLTPAAGKILLVPLLPATALQAISAVQ